MIRTGEGRRAQLLVLSLAFAAMFASAPGQSFLIAVFVDEILADAGLSRTAFAALYAAATVVSASAMVAVGRAADRSGLRAVWIAVTLGLALACAAASLVSGLALAFVALALLRTFGQGSFPLVGTLLVNRWFGARRGQAMAVATFGLTAASVALPPLVVLLILEVGWENGFRLLGLAVLALMLPLAVLVREPAGGRGRVDVPVAGAGRFPRALRAGRPTRRAMRLLLVLSAPPLIMTAIIFHATSLLGARGLSLTEAGLALSVLGILSAVGTIGGGAVADRTSTRALLSAMSALLAASAAVLLVQGRVAAYAGFALLGLAGGLFGIASGIVWARTYGLAQLGQLQGTSFAVQIAAAAAGPLPLAVSLGLTDSYRPALVGLAAYGLLALLVALRWRDPRAVRRRRYNSNPST